MIFKPPMQISYNVSNLKIFLAGTIDMGNSENWQDEAIRLLQLYYTENVDVYNPRRDDWDASWVQTFNNPEFFQQVSWELDAMDKADYILMNFTSESKSPITLLELGLYAQSKKVHVCCPDDFYRSGNVKIVCNKYNIPMYKSLRHLIINLQDNE